MRASLELLASMREAFVEEAGERLATLETLLLAFESNSADNELIHSIFREAHSLKGGAAACQLDELTSFAHTFENLLAQMRHGALAPRAETHGLMLESTDALHALLQRARGLPARLDEGDIACIEQRLRDELIQAGLLDAAETKHTPDDGVLELMFWDDEPAPAQSEAVVEASVPPIAAHEPAQQEIAIEHEETLESADDELEDNSDATLEHNALGRLIDLSIELSIVTAALSHALTDPAQISVEQVRSLLSQSQAHADEIQTALAGARASSSSAILDVVLLRAGEQTFFVPLEYVDQYISLNASELRAVPAFGEVLMHEGRMLQPLRLTSLFGLATHTQPATRDQGAPLVAVTLRPKFGQFALIVDAVVTQTRIVLRQLEPDFRAAGALLGAALYGGAVVLVLDPPTLFGMQAASRREAQAQKKHSHVPDSSSLLAPDPYMARHASVGVRRG